MTAPTNTQVQRLLLHERLIDDALASVTSSGNPNESVASLLECLGTTYQCSRVELFEERASGDFGNTQEWCAAGVHSKMQHLQHVPAEALEAQAARGATLISLEWEGAQDGGTMHGVLYLDGAQKSDTEGCRSEVPANIIVKLLAATLAHRDELNLREENNTEDPLTGGLEQAWLLSLCAAGRPRRMCRRDLLRAFWHSQGEQACWPRCRRCRSQRAGAHAAGKFPTSLGVPHGQQRFFGVLPGSAGRSLQSACWRTARHSPGTRDSRDGTNCMGGRHARWARAARAAGDVGLSAQPTSPNSSSPQPPVGLSRKTRTTPRRRCRGRFSAVRRAGVGSPWSR